MDTSNIKAVVFDLDGTLLDTAKDLGKVVNDCLSSRGFRTLPLDAYIPLIGHGIRNLVRSACPDEVTDEIFEDIMVEYLSTYPEKCTILTDFFPGIPELLKALEDAGYVLAVLSNKTETITKKIIQHYMSHVPFTFVWGNNGTRPLKPALDAGALACETLGLKPEEILYFGDGDTDMEFGSKSGFCTIGCTWGYRSPAVLREYGAHELVETPQELLDLLGK